MRQGTTHTSYLCECENQLACDVFCHLPHPFIHVFAAGKWMRRYSLERQSACGRGEGEGEGEKKKSKKKRGRDCTFNRLSQTVLGGSAVCAGTSLHPEHVLLKFEIKIKCLDPDFYAEQTEDFCLLPNLTNSINHCDEITVAGCTNASEAALPSKHRDITQRSFSSPNITKLFFFTISFEAAKMTKMHEGSVAVALSSGSKQSRTHDLEI